jgi:hypothetical protein
MRWRLLIFLFLLPFLAGAQSYRLRGTVTDSIGQPLPSAHIQLFGQKRKATTSGAGGEFAMTIPKGEYRIEISYTGFKRLIRTFTIKSDTIVSFPLESKAEELNEVIISAYRTLQSDQFQTTRMSTNTLSGKEISSIPVLGGEADLIKTIQLLPGVTKGADGTTDLFCARRSSRSEFGFAGWCACLQHGPSVWVSLRVQS